MIPHSASSAFHSYIPNFQTEFMSSCFPRGALSLVALQTQGNKGKFSLHVARSAGRKLSACWIEYGTVVPQTLTHTEPGRQPNDLLGDNRDLPCESPQRVFSKEGRVP